MRASTVIVLAAVAVAASSPLVFAAPQPAHLDARDVDVDLLARELLERADASESGAISTQDLKDFGNGFVKGFTGTIEKLAPLVTAFLKREDLELLARAAADESGAISTQDLKDFGNGFVKGFTGTFQAVAPLITAFLKREELELLARESLLRRAVPDESGALSFQDVKDFGKGFVQGFTGTIEKLAPVVTAFLKREDLELLAREELLRRASASTDASGALSFQDVKDFGNGFVKGFTGTVEALAPVVTAFLKREEFDLVAREAYLSRRAEVDASGALSFQDLKDFGSGFVKGFTGTLQAVAPIAAAFIKREHVELMAREMYEYQARQIADVQSGALNFDDVKNFAKDFGQGFVKGFTGTLQAVAPIAAAFVKREDMDLLARGVFDSVYARSLNELD